MTKKKKFPVNRMDGVFMTLEKFKPDPTGKLFFGITETVEDTKLYSTEDALQKLVKLKVEHPEGWYEYEEGEVPAFAWIEDNWSYKFFSRYWI